jgi:FG-GAP repeat
MAGSRGQARITLCALVAFASATAIIPATAEARSLRTPMLPADRYGEIVPGEEPAANVVVRVPPGRAAVTPLGIRWRGKRPTGAPRGCEPSAVALGEALAGPARIRPSDVKRGTVRRARTTAVIAGAGLRAPRRVPADRLLARATTPQALAGWLHVRLPKGLLPLYPRRDLYVVALDLTGEEQSNDCSGAAQRRGEAAVRMALRGVRFELPPSYRPPPPDQAPPTTDLATGGGLELLGHEQEESAGQTVAAAGDVNGDGYQDALVSAPYEAVGRRGSVYVVFGHPGGGLATLGDPAVAGFRIDGPRGRTWRMPAVGVGDMDGDGLADIAVGTPTEAGPRDGGAVYIVRGKADGEPVDLTTRADVLFRIAGSRPCPGRIGGEDVGQVVADAGDANRDGISDVAILAPGNCGEGSPTGSVYVVYGKSAPGDIDLQHLGSGGIAARGIWVGSADIAGVGDVNGDGLADVVAGNLGYDTAAYAAVIPGRRGGGTTNLARPAMKITSELCASLGTSVAAAGDVNGDGLGDIALGDSASCADLASHAFVVFGRPGFGHLNVDLLNGGGYDITGTQFTAGHALASAGDLNGDGIPDLALGDPDFAANGRSQAGGVMVVYGKRDGTRLRLRTLGAGGFRWLGPQPDFGLGFSLAGLGDFDGDSRPDLITGMTRRAGYAGGAWVLPTP